MLNFRDSAFAPGVKSRLFRLETPGRLDQDQQSNSLQQEYSVSTTEKK